MIDQCTDKRLGDRLYAYETGMLDDDDRVEFEIHLLECKYCNSRALRFEQTARLIRHDSKIREAVARMDSEPPAPRSRRTRLVGAAVAVVAMLVLLILKPWQIEIHPSQEAMAEESRLAVMHFDNLVDAEDSRRLGEIAANLLITDLSESRYVQVVSVQRLHDILKLLGWQGSGVPRRDVATRVAREARAAWLLTGSILQVQPHIVVTAQLVEVSTGESLASYRIEGDAGDNLFSLTDDLTVQVKGSLSLPLAAIEEPDPHVADVTTHSPEAYQHYVESVDHQRKFRYADAVTGFEKALEFDSSFAMAYYHLAVLKDPRLVAWAVKYADRASHRERLYIRSLEAEILGNRQLAIDILHEVLERYPEEKSALHRLASQESARHQPEKAVELLNRAIAIDPLDKSVYNDLAYAYDKIGNSERALAAADRYVELAPDEPNPYDTRGEILARNGRLDEAIESYGRVHAIEPDFYGYASLFKLGRLHVYRGDYAEAREYFQEAAASQRQLIRSRVRTCLALVPLYQGKLKEALDILNDGIALDSSEQVRPGQILDRSVKHFLKARIYVEKNDFDRAQEELAKAVEIQAEASMPAYRNMYAQVLADGGRLAGAEEVAQVLREESQQGVVSSRSAYWYTTGCIEMARGDPEQAVTSFERAVAATNNLESNIMLARAYVVAGRYSEAVALLEELLPDYSIEWRLVLGIWTVKAYYYVGLAYEHTDRINRAIESYEEFLRIWANADPCFSEVEDARRRLAKLRSRP